MKLKIKIIRPTINRLLKIFHVLSRYFKTHPRMRALVLMSSALAFVSAMGVIGWRQWKLALLSVDEDHVATIHRSEEDLTKYGITFIDAAPGKLAVELKVPGEVKLNGDALAHMVPRFPGVVRQVHKNLGDVVKKGEVLAVFENNANLAVFEMRSQIDGVIIEKNATLGEVIGSSEEAFVIADLSKVWVDLFIYPTDLSRVKAGQHVRVIDQTSNREIAGTLAYVGPTISNHTRTALARVVLDNPDMVWRPGTFVTGAIVVDEGEVPVMIDAAAVQDLTGVPTVFLKKGDEFIATPVRLGRRDDKHIEVLDGVTVGSRLASTGSFLLKAEIAKGNLEEHVH